MLCKHRRSIIRLATLIITLVLIASIKDSNLFMFSLLAVLSIYIILRQKLYKLSHFKQLAAAASVIAILLLFNPYITNLYVHHSIDYPYNTATFASSLRSQGVPVNINKDNRFELFFYGIFSQASLGSSTNKNNAQSFAHLKIPFSLTVNDLVTESSVISKTVGGYGVLFSGILLVSLCGLVYLFAKDIRSKNRKTILYLTAILLLIIGSCLISPVPNYSRYISQLFLIPIAIAAVLLMTASRSIVRKFIGLVIVGLLLTNAFLDASLSYTDQYSSFKDITSQLNTLAGSKQTYLVNDGSSYSSYQKLKSHGVKIIESPKPISCPNEVILDFSLGSTLCKI